MRSFYILALGFLLVIQSAAGFQRSIPALSCRRTISLRVANEKETAEEDTAGKNKDNKAMDFLRRIGRVGGPRQDMTHVIGVDEGSLGRSSGSMAPKKSLQTFQSCTDSGVIDDLTECFPTTTSGTTWTGYTDQVMGGLSVAILTREEAFHGRTANVLRGRVSLENNGGFVQMATNLAKDPSKQTTVDASAYDGVELDTYYDGMETRESFNVHLKTEACPKPYSSYRATFNVPQGEWTTVRLPWSSFKGKGPGASEVPFDYAALTRAGIVAIGKPMERLVLAVSGFGFYKERA